MYKMNLYQLKWRKSKDLLDKFIADYNQNRPVREQLRANHKALAQYLLFIYSAYLQKEQAYGDKISVDKALPLLRTNNVQLSKAIGCSERTVINLRERLRVAGVITKEVFRGSNASYGVELSASIIYLQEVGNPNNVIHLFPGMAKSLRHTVTSTIQVTKELIELSGVDFQQTADFQSNELILAVDKGVESRGIPENVVEKRQNSSSQGTKQGTGTGYEDDSHAKGTPPPVAAAPPKATKGRGVDSVAGVPNQPRVADPKTARPPQNLHEALVDKTKEVADSIRRQVQVIWTCALLNLYDDKWIADEEAERAKAAIAEYFIYTTPDRFSGGAAEIIDRIMLVRGWIERGQAKGERRWVPLPSRYFDFRNKTGFTATKKWFKGHIKAKADMKAKELVSKAVKEYLRAQEPGAKIGPSETYRRISQRLGKYDSDLLDRFHERITNLNEPEQARAVG